MGAQRRKCRCCHKLFRPDPRNRYHQRYCAAGSHSSAQKPVSNSRPYTPAAVRTVLQAPCGLIPGEVCAPVLTTPDLITTRLRRFACARLLDTHLSQVVPGTFDPTFTAAAFGRSGSESSTQLYSTA